ncbi:MAG TPA: hypothetical protein VHZ24_14355 [Pirellulales bacterium]|jgi:hypothetical protein|nr:hypothetical protein [Pirellulales bacterium]
MLSRQTFRSRYARVVSVLLLLGAVSAIVGCTPFSNFRSQCECASCKYSGAADLSGCWEGTWCSQHSGHNGYLDAVITPCGGGKYHARFHATFFKFFSYEYETTLTAYAQDGVYHFSGQKDLGRIAGGMYYYNGTTTACDFYATYCSSKDHGVFKMRRKSCTACCR